MNDLVSIITPSYNAEKFIAETIESVFAQTYPYWEMIIVDDCSSDTTNNVVSKYVLQDKRIKHIQLTENRGAAFSRNRAISKAEGRYIAFLDADDQWLPHKLERQIIFMQQHDLAFTYSSYLVIDECGADRGKFITKKSIQYQDLLKTCSIGCLTAIYDSAKLGKMYMPDIAKRQDYALWLAILKKIGTTEGILEPLAIYRKVDNSVSSNKLKAAAYQWKIYRDVEGLPIYKAIYCFGWYAYNGIVKYKS